MTPLAQHQLRKVRLLILLFIIGLVLSGITAMPVQTQLDIAAKCFGVENLTPPATDHSAFIQWLVKVRAEVTRLNVQAPYIFYGFDWLAFGHISVAIAFIWAYRDPIQHRFLFNYGLVLCALIPPWAILTGTIRGIPGWWMLIDCSFAILGSIPLLLCKILIESMGNP